MNSEKMDSFLSSQVPVKMLVGLR